MRALVTGGAGFVGQWLARALLARDATVTLASVEPLGEQGVLTAAERARVRTALLDVRNAADVARAVDDAAPDVVFHLAGVSHVPAGERDPALTWEVNTLGAVRLLDAVARRRHAGTMDPVVVVVGSGEQYGRHDADALPLDEAAEQRPVSSYAATKVTQEVAALRAWRADGVRVVCTRSFNHSGPGQAAQFLLPSLVARVLAVRRGESAEVVVGNAEVVRDYLHVADVVEAYLALAERGVPGTAYNVSSGVAVSVRELADAVLSAAGVRAEISSQQALRRDADVPALVGSPARLQAATGWAPRRGRDQIIEDLLNAATR